VPAFRGRLHPTALLRADDGRAIPLDTLAGGPLVAVAGIAHPERLGHLLTRAGLRVAEVLSFPDHHAYGPADVDRLCAAAARGTLVTTEKDLVKLTRLPGLPPLLALRVVLEVEEGERLVDRLVDGLAPRRAGELDLRPDCS
jgi:tetraacyldisaccharide 4'-kinase